MIIIIDLKCVSIHQKIHNTIYQHLMFTEQAHRKENCFFTHIHEQINNILFLNIEMLRLNWCIYIEVIHCSSCCLDNDERSHFTWWLSLLASRLRGAGWVWQVRMLLDQKTACHFRFIDYLRRDLK